jgi:tetratricopeptide (TPR) repeat protein
MGFSLTQARQALASTSTGLDVQIALEMLISETQSGSSAGPPAPFSSRNGAGRYDNEQEDDDEAHAFRLQREEEEAAAERHRRRRRQGPSRDGARRNEQQEAEQREAKEQEERDVASRLLERGNAIGVSLFNKAGALWGEGKMQVQKAMEERARAVAAAAAGAGEGGGGVVADGRPRWMQEAAAASEREEQEVGRGKEREKISFKDSDGEEEEEATALGVRNGAGPSSSARRLPMDQSRRQQEDSQPTASVASVGAKIGSLFSAFTADETPPPSRQQQQPAQSAQPSFTNSRRRPQQPSSSSSSTPRQATPQLPPRPVTPPPAALLVRRSLPAISPQALSLSLASREKGNAAFKLGQYPEATAHYTTALSHLPPSHLLTIPLLNNRASSLLKEGERARAIEDTSAVIELVGMGYDPRREVACDWNAFGAGTGGKGVDLGEALIKAVGKRAAASEAGERWEEAGKDWERVVQGWGGVSIGGREKAAALDGARRCRKMVGGGGESTSAAPARAPLPARPKPKPKPVALSSEPLKQSAALDALRSTAATAASDDALRLSLKDSVDARLFAWRRGKETNLRALIASLENILPPTFNWVKVGLHELVTEKQVKVRYVKAIGKVHPDKLSAAGVEERMIAGGVFGALNEG